MTMGGDSLSARPKDQDVADRIRMSVELFIRGKSEVVELALISLVAEGHLLLDDVPGVGKTTLARTLSNAIGLDWSRIQFTPDLLPSDLSGVSVFDQRIQSFDFRTGPIFASIVLADEINRASPRTQAALLEAMEERTVTVDGETHGLPSPFVVIATQNPVDMAGTYPLPEAQLDRFLMRTSMGYPDHDSEVAVVTDHHEGASRGEVTSVVTPEEVRALIAAAASVRVAPSLVDYLVRLVSWTRTAPGVTLGASPRASVAMLRAIRARALIHGRDAATPSDVQALAGPVLAHRIIVDVEGQARGLTQADVIAQAVESVPAPQPA